MINGVQILIIVCILLTTAVCCWRFYLRLFVSRRYIASEFTLLAALICLLANSGMQIQMINLLSNAPGPEDLVKVKKLLFASPFFYLGTLWGVKISVNLLHMHLTIMFPNIYVWAVRSFLFQISSLPFIYVTYLVACLPINRHWSTPQGVVKACPPISRRWDFWTHLAIHISTDIWLCILPFTALRQIQEKRLRIAVFGVYSLSAIAIIVGIVRAILLGINAQANVDFINTLSVIELSTTVIIGALPGISSSFVRKYVYSNGVQIMSLRPWTGKTATLSQQQETKILCQGQGQGHEFNKFSGSADYVELRDAKQTLTAPASTRGYTAECDTGLEG